MSSALMDDGSRVIQQEVNTQQGRSFSSTLNNDGQNSSHVLLDEFYEIEKSVNLIVEYGFRRVCLQFPDYLLPDATAVSHRLQQVYRERTMNKMNNVGNHGQKQSHDSSSHHPIVNQKQEREKQQQSVNDIEDVLSASTSSTHHTMTTTTTATIDAAAAATTATATDSSSSSSPLHIYILGDTSYGSCCVDEVNAQHVHSDFIIHYGNACLNMLVNRRIPVLHIFGRDVQINVESCYESLVQVCNDMIDEMTENSNNGNNHSSSRRLIVMYDLLNTHAIYHELREMCQQRMTMSHNNDNNNSSSNIHEVIYRKKSNRGDNDDSGSGATVQIMFAELNQDAVLQNLPKQTTTTTTTTTTSDNGDETITTTTTGGDGDDNHRVIQGLKVLDRYFKRVDHNDDDNDDGSDAEDLPRDSVFYVTSDTSRMTSLLMELNQYHMHVYDTSTNAVQSSSLSTVVQRHLKRRYYLVQLAREAQVIGLVVATTSIANYLRVLAYLKQLIAQCDKKYYVFFVGKINVPKLANFELIDLFCMIGCSHEDQSSALFDHSRDYLKPIVTPFELELALNSGSGGGREWNPMDYTIDFNQLLRSSSTHSGDDDEAKITQESTVNDGGDDDDDEYNDYEYSFISGTIRRKINASSSSNNTTNNSIHQFSDSDALQSGGQLMHYDESQRALMQTQLTPAMSHLAHREYRGLAMDENIDEETGEVEQFAKLEIGRSGIACDYSHEHDEKHK